MIKDKQVAPLHNRQSKDNEINPNFKDSQLLEPENLKTHIKGVTKPDAPTPHAEILDELLNEFKPLDFHALAFPEAVELRQQLKTLDDDDPEAKAILKQLNSFKLKQRHYLILSVENVIETAKNNRWGICKNHDFIYLFNGEFWTIVDKEAFQKFFGRSSRKNECS